MTADRVSLISHTKQKRGEAHGAEAGRAESAVLHAPRPPGRQGHARLAATLPSPITDHGHFGEGAEVTGVHSMSQTIEEVCPDAWYPKLTFLSLKIVTSIVSYPSLSASSTCQFSSGFHGGEEHGPIQRELAKDSWGPGLVGRSTGMRLPPFPPAPTHRRLLQGSCAGDLPALCSHAPQAGRLGQEKRPLCLHAIVPVPFRGKSHPEA